MTVPGPGPGTASPRYTAELIPVFVLVAVPVPALGLLTYQVPDGVPAPPIGARVVVPLGTRSVTGIVAGAVEASDPESRPVKAIKSVLDVEPFVPAAVVELARWTAEYYGAGVGETITAVLPPKARGERADAHRTRRVASITAAGLDAIDLRAPKQREALAILTGDPTGVPTAQLASRGIGADTVRRLVQLGLVSIRQERLDRDPYGGIPLASSAPAIDRALTDEQASALERLSALAAAAQFRAALLHGVTGSGKTEIYVRLSKVVCAAGRRVVMLVPEIALTPAVVAIFRDTFGDRVAVQHSGLSDGERHDQWQRIRRGDVDVVVGTRSAVFAPVADVGLVIVDEEHDTSYKQEESPRYNARDVAIVRAQRAGALVVLGSATPSMETYHNALSGKFERITLERRVHSRPLASVRIVDMREEYAAEGPDVIVSRALRDAVATRLERREQSLILLNRRGFATAVFCRQCGDTIDCPHCSVSLVIHGEGPSRRARCHYCSHSARVPRTCPTCAAPYMDQTGFGTERVEAEIKRLYPTARVARLDRDAVRLRGSLASLLSRFQAGAIDVMVGTQMIAKGHDFHRVTLVGVVSADVGLGMADFRASERTFQILTQVAGRAGRGEQGGEAIVQTLYPGHYAIQLACRQDYPAFYAREMAFRRAMRYPPEVSLVNVVVRARTLAQALDDAGSLARWIGETANKVKVLGPAPAPLGKLRGEFRVQLLLKGLRRKGMREALMSVLSSRPALARRTTVDIDPLSVL